ncbi:hypothetical protein [Thiocystis violacea]|uniref:hypothetical protein n=1 Tax=Thiocystis violacea TaxID=13725 RepID=UPI001902C63B|nr:hypothetical protein [Thiocystis violacea]
MDKRSAVHQQRRGVRWTSLSLVHPTGPTDDQGPKLQLRDLSDEALLHDVGGFRRLIGSIQALILELAKRSFVSRVTKLELHHQSEVRPWKMDSSLAFHLPLHLK